MDTHIHGLLLQQFAVQLLDGPFAGLTVQVSSCCSPPWLFYVSRGSHGPVAWHPEQIAPAIEDAAEYLREGGLTRAGIATAVYLPYRNSLADTA